MKHYRRHEAAGEIMLSELVLRADNENVTSRPPSVRCLPIIQVVTRADGWSFTRIKTPNNNIIIRAPKVLSSH